ncbi:Sensors of blue-light using FAD [Sphingomonas palmae]|uniref:Sensors of blue-light using FAD n=1 Tax=Sphingomonas palmae TaxID=1855283 RepID=A0A1H7HD58_9SPHN|nr:BLUF domain-containing protein [Sphingomonas palmae]SEK46930.1 Sensors of blue-light using FAD [Sphingomonas palmae]
MLQLVYISSVAQRADLPSILAKSRINNRRDNITGLLYSDGVRFLQALEGPALAVETAYERIRQDPRHNALVILSRREVEAREFGDWAMAERRVGEEADQFCLRVDRLLANTGPNVRATFDSFIKLRHAA